jgi:glutamate-1-semialdehyde 2,1-aminomutase
MTANLWLNFIFVIIALYILRKLQIRLRLSRAKHPSLRGHAKMSRLVAKLVPFYEYDEKQFFCSDGAPAAVAGQRQAGFERLQKHFNTKAPKSIALTQDLESSISDILFTNAYRVPYQYRNYVRSHLKLGTIATATTGTRIQDLDGNWSYDLSGSYGVNVFGYDFYKDCLEKGYERVKELGPVLGPYHPVIAENVAKLKAISGLDEVSFHMSGTEAVMQAVRLARYHTGKSHLVRFCGAYHGWWDGVQPGIGNERKTDDVYTLKDMDEATLKVLRTRKNIACVLINPLQALHPNANAPSDAMLIASDRAAHYDRQAYTEWLQTLRKVCDERGIVLIMDEVFMGFRLAHGGAQEYFNVRADIVTYGKTLGGGLPIGVVCGKHHLMKRFRDDRPTQISFARGTFNSHPYVMGAMNEFLRKIESPEIQASYASNDELWNERVMRLNERLAEKDLPVKVANMSSVWTILYTRPGRYNWMFQYYLRAQGLAISWVGSGRMIMSHNFSNEDYEAVMQRFVAAAQAMEADGWWWQSPDLTNKTIKKQVFREMLATVFK